MKQPFFYRSIPLGEMHELIKLEPKLADFINFDHPFNVRLMPDHFQCLVHSVISQQLSSAAVDTIWNKLIFSFKKITPENMASATTEQLNAIGLSAGKITAIKKISYDIVDHRLNLKKLGKKNNDIIRETLTKYKFIGDWTVDMMLIFSYYRNNVLPISDFGIRQGLKKLFGIDEITETFTKGLVEKFNIHLTLFAFCLWQISRDK